MTDVFDDATVLDPGRRRPTVAGPTVLDPGRRRPSAPEPTVLDPGRARPPDRERQFAATLPPALDDRFTVVRVIRSAPAEFRRGEGDVMLVRERGGGGEWVLKLYRDAGPAERVGAFLTGRHSHHLVEVRDVGEADGRGYEVMEHLSGGSLADLAAAHPDGFDPATVTEIVGQLAEAVAELHHTGLVHRDVKPDNIMVRSLDPFEVALIDFGLATHVSGAETQADRSGTLRYMPPEFVSGGLLSPAYDWWSLGACVRELATGQPPFPEMDDDNVRSFVCTGPVPLNDVVNDRLLLLCQGLLAPEPVERWGAAAIEQWRRAESPPVSAVFSRPSAAAEPGFPGSDEAQEPFVYLDVRYHSRALLAAAMTATWETAAHLLFGGVEAGPREELAGWLAGYPGATGEWRDGAELPADIRLLNLLRWMAPAHPPIYRGLNIACATLPRVATEALGGEGNAPSIVEELFRYSLLPLLATGSAASGLDGGDGLSEVDERWRAEQRRWTAAVATLTDAEALDVLRAGEADEAQRRVLALCLRAAVASDEERARIGRQLTTVARRLRMPWFSALVENPDALWVAYRLLDHARERARAEARRRAWLVRNERFREWSRRENRPLALAWAVAGLALLGAACALLIAVGDIAGRASDGAIFDAWTATVFALGLALGCEAALAWEIGGRFHPRYSMLGAGFIALGRAARTVSGRGIALVVVVGVLGSGYVLAVFAPVALPLAAGGGALLWTVRRHLSWSADRDREHAEIERGRQERRVGNAAAEGA